VAEDALWGDDYEDQWYEDRGGNGPALLGEDEVSGGYDSDFDAEATAAYDAAWQATRHTASHHPAFARTEVNSGRQAKLQEEEEARARARREGEGFEVRPIFQKLNRRSLFCAAPSRWRPHLLSWLPQSGDRRNDSARG